ncbi:FKBP-type peptidyl-prolyl cis-trans isomerase FklB [Dyadobacter jejuensis]|uniref:Peptidyl-prolyl cis-trans isomerase n=1 Tax=Dyadobacter jejuensis TaxID=1082580 RepID=A0A316AQA0_9BACT|nr:FKBP-type peptidyl-prolyl cis-trans isomerase [Dyadobacter jejuensis]PWJ59439.1 FKBP-type peptidyl-prolyl cis-trans isomerase FklB [Dyadobacter jejuensis]
MYKLEKSLLAAALFSALAVTPSFAQGTKKAAPSAASKSTHATKAPVATNVLKNTTDSLSAAIGVSFSNSVSSQGIDDLNVDVLVQEIRKSLKGDSTIFTSESANAFIGQYFQNLMEKKGAAVKIAGEEFLAQNAKKDSVHTTESGLQYKVLKAGTGPKPVVTDKVKAHYHGTLIDGTVFDSSVERGEPIEIPVSGVIKGWTEALQLMPVGSKWQLYIPYDLAYGERQAGPQIPAYSALVFDVELLSIIEQEKPAEKETLKEVK